MSVGIQKYTQLITSEHNQQPNFMAMVAATLQPSVDAQNLISTFVSLFDLDLAQGNQLDIIGQWVGISRNVNVPISGVFFAWDTANLGWNQGTWLGPGQSGTSLIMLSDNQYRALLKAKIAANQWDGTVPGIYKAWIPFFVLSQFNILIKDNQDMSMTVFLLTSVVIDQTLLALITGGYVVPRPAGVRITGYTQIMSVPVFGFDVQNSIISGWDSGQWSF